jgi:hypothetical protein|nr:MAG TPA: hypothetical protein [Caudoviricetes sp.]
MTKAKEITLPIAEYKKLKKDAEKWRAFHEKVAANAKKRWQKRTPEERAAEMEELRKYRKYNRREV